MNRRITVKFLGGIAHAKYLTGSCIYIEIRKKKQTTCGLIDAGMHQGPFEESARINRDLKIDAKTLDFIIITHSHTDHSGRLPLFYKMGFRGKVFCTIPNNDLMEVMLQDTFKILQNNSRNRRRRNNHDAKEENSHKKFSRKSKDRFREKRGKPSSPRSFREPLFSFEDLTASLGLVKNGGFDYQEWILIDKGIDLKFYPSGHVLGGAICVLKIDADKPTSKPIYIGFSGDLGRKDGIILPPPEIIREPIDHWCIESTYGGKTHPPREEEIGIFLDVIREAVKKKGKVIIPSFAFERTQEIIYLASYYMKNGLIPAMAIYLDAPLAKKITEVFKYYWKSKMFKDQDMLDFNPFDPAENPYLKIIESEEESDILTQKPGPYIVTAGSGMGDFGRIRNHLMAGLNNENNCVCIIGFMTQGTLGEKLRSGFPLVKINDHEIQVRASVAIFRSFSAHSDDPYLTEYTTAVINQDKPDKKTICIVHGNEKSGLCLKKSLIDSLGEKWSSRILIPGLNEVIRLN